VALVQQRCMFVPIQHQLYTKRTQTQR